MPANRARELPPWLWPRAAYVHVPFCAHHCGYCDFAVTAGQDHLIDLYLEALTEELARLRDPAPVRTLFLGGGTPTHLNPRQLECLLSDLARWLPLEDDGAAPPEFSVESTPDSLDSEKADLLAAFGVNRVSVGVQTFNARLLPALDRVHNADQIPGALEAARRRILQLSLDLIFGIPGQRLDEWAADLAQAIAYGTDHLSAYGLTYEKGTPLWKQRQRGQVRPVDEETERAMYLHAIDQLTAAGFEHYEISNFAKPGRRCRHNEVYWANEAYWGFGVGAARYVMGRRELNTRNTQEYIRRVLSDEAPTFQSEELPPEERARETFAVQLRRADGIDRDRFSRQTGFHLDVLMGPKLADYTAEGFLEDDGRRVRLTREGKCVADALIESLL
jgi:putative oxygen-independent coproporphyrinogen III oxidase